MEKVEHFLFFISWLSEIEKHGRNADSKRALKRVLGDRKARSRKIVKRALNWVVLKGIIAESSPQERRALLR